MDYREIISIAEKKLGNDYEYIIKDLKDCVSKGSTGGEIMSIVGKYLKILKENNDNAYSILKEDINKYLFECEKQGLIIN